ncbi:unnamed protein product [Pleuronectes platessa]|uniref:Uncharacterized protein n=1 Tax=Pleuronectes platessa TaxID=8262 RepID=A0A9N7YVR1_PLEPL|nr:unnamed protein product [Pleuronectes platessa]
MRGSDAETVTAETRCPEAEDTRCQQLMCLSVSEWTRISTVPLFRDLKWLQPQPVPLHPIFLHQQLPINQTPQTEQQISCKPQQSLCTDCLAGAGCQALLNMKTNPLCIIPDNLASHTASEKHALLWETSLLG